MRSSLPSILLVLLTCLAAPLRAAEYNVSIGSISHEQQRSLSVTTNDVVLITAPSGAVALVQFTRFGAGTAAYRWRYRPARLQQTISGEGDVRESYEHKVGSDGVHDVTPTAEHDTIVRAGELSIEWSYGSANNGWLYYYPSRATIQVLGAESFEKSL